MTKGRILLLGSWVIIVGILFKCTPKDKIRHAMVAFFYKQTLTWFLGLFVSEKNLIQYPIRFFKKASKSHFSFEYFVFPSLCSIFNIHYPEKKNKIYIFFYYAFFTGIITSLEVMAERYTQLIKYINWRWEWSFVSMWLSFYSSRLFYRWFFLSGK